MSNPPNPHVLAISSPYALLLALCVAVVLSSTALAEEGSFRVATFNVSLYGSHAGEVVERLRGGADPQARALAEIIQRVRPDILLLNEIDYTPDNALLTLFAREYLAVQQNVSGADNAAEPIVLEHRYAAPVNTGIHSAMDLNNDGRVSDRPGDRTYGNDCWGFGVYPGQYGMAVLSKFPIAADEVRTFQQFLWKDMPGAQLPDDRQTPEPADWYSPEELARFRLSSKSHWDVPVDTPVGRLHLLASHPTPPVFDGPEDRNGRRNHDEIRFWQDYTGPVGDAAYVYDDKGRQGGLEAGEPFVILGDLNADPHDGENSRAIAPLLESPQVRATPTPSSAGGSEAAALQQGVNQRHAGDPRHDTLDARDDGGPGNLRVDYVLPSRELAVKKVGVFWPATDDPLYPLTGVFPFPSSDHRLVWIDVSTDTNIVTNR